MCILTYVRTDEGFVITHNRDESMLRYSTKVLQRKEKHSVVVDYPEDKQSKGTWFFSSNKYVSVILNGAKEKHKRKPPYKRSRGQVIFDVLAYRDLDSYFDAVDLEGIESFTQFLVDVKTEECKILTWDGLEKQVEKFTGDLLIRSSSTLYTKQEKEANQQKILTLLQAGDGPSELFDLHHKIKLQPHQKRFGLATTAITQCVFTKEKGCLQVKMNYQRLGLL